MRKNKLGLLLLSGILFGCGNDISDLQTFTERTREQTKADIEPIPKIQDFEHFEYKASGLRSPFVEPKPELTQSDSEIKLDCLQPNYARRRGPLEKYPLDNISMRGTMGRHGDLTALASTTDGTLYRLEQGDYMGLFHGRIVEISNQYILLEEMVPDGTGCWELRNAQIPLWEADTGSGNK